MSTTNALPGARPIPGVLFGITHSPDGSLIIKEAKLLKVGIGLAKGPALSVWTQRDGASVKWKITRGYSNEDGNAKKETFTCDNRAQAEQLFAEKFLKAPICTYPRKVGYFTFTKPTMVDGQEHYLPDFEAIEQHGPMPTEIDIVLLDDNPLDGAYQMWSAAELKCRGDGITAMRVVTLATTEEEKKMAKLAVDAGARRYPIINGCWTCGCPYAQPGQDARGRETPSPCKPGADLRLQLAFSLRVGGSAFFHTSGIRSIQQLASSLYRIRTLTGGRLMGIPLKMTLHPYKTNHNGQAAIQFGVGLEFRAENMRALREKLNENVFALRELAGNNPVKLIETTEPDETTDAGIEGEEDNLLSPAAMTAEFGGLDEPAAPAPAMAPVAAAATAAPAKTDGGLSSKLKAAQKKLEPEPPATPGPVAVPDKKDLF